MDWQNSNQIVQQHFDHSPTSCVPSEIELKPPFDSSYVIHSLQQNPKQLRYQGEADHYLNSLDEEYTDYSEAGEMTVPHLKPEQLHQINQSENFKEIKEIGEIGEIDGSNFLENYSYVPEDFDQFPPKTRDIIKIEHMKHFMDGSRSSLDEPVSSPFDNTSTFDSDNEFEDDEMFQDTDSEYEPELSSEKKVKQEKKGTKSKTSKKKKTLNGKVEKKKPGRKPQILDEKQREEKGKLRQLKNREAAKRCREKKQKHMIELERQVAALKRENEELRRLISVGKRF